MNTHNEIWIGLLGLYPCKKNIYIKQNEGAYANVLIMSDSVEDFISKANKFAKDLEFDVFCLEDIEPLKARLKSYVIDGELSRLSEIIRSSKESQISTLHVFDRKDL